MAKYYIESGDVRVVVSAVDAEAASLFVLNQTVNRVLPTGTTDPIRLDDIAMKYATQCLEVLGNEFHVSELGFGHSEVAIFDSELIFKRWCELTTAINHLMDRLEE